MFEEHATNFHADELQFLSYFETTWIGAPVGGAGLRLPPTFPIEMWSVHGRHQTGSTRTTNSLESFHNTFNSLLSCQHPSTWKLLEALRRQQGHTNLTKVQVDQGFTFVPSSKQQDRNARINLLVAQYTRADAARLLTGIAYNYLV